MIRFRCPHADCGKPLTVKDEVAGRAGKCPACGASLVVPQPAPEESGNLLTWEAEALPLGPPAPGASVESKPAGPILPDAWHGDTWDADLDVPGTATGRVVSYGAIGLGWQLLRDRYSTWLLATVVMWLVLGGLGIVLQLLTVGLLFGEYYLLGPHPVPLAPFVSVVLNVGIQGLLVGGQIRMALKQIDGGEIAVGDMFSLGGAGNAERVIKGMLVTCLLTAVASVFLILPGLIVAALSVFTLPLIVDGGMPASAALAASFRTLSASGSRPRSSISRSW